MACIACGLAAPKLDRSCAVASPPRQPKSPTVLSVRTDPPGVLCLDVLPRCSSRTVTRASSSVPVSTTHPSRTTVTFNLYASRRLCRSVTSHRVHAASFSARFAPSSRIHSSHVPKFALANPNRCLACLVACNRRSFAYARTKAHEPVVRQHLQLTRLSLSQRVRAPFPIALCIDHESILSLPVPRLVDLVHAHVRMRFVRSHEGDDVARFDPDARLPPRL